MTANTIDTKKVLELKNMRFFVPAYQRGYRWTEIEVKALLEDIWEFDTQNGNLEYCIQPLITKRCEDGKYEVVDGQQRLTTIYIFMKLVQEIMPKSLPIFSIEYETRKDSASFLNSLSPENNTNDTNIDYHFMGCAYKAMRDWVDEKVKSNVGDESTIIPDLNNKIKNSVFFIWYELPKNSDPIEMFSKVNIGKIPLTNAELIKALLLNSDNFKNFSPETAATRQAEISVSWDKIEQELHHDSLWYFLNDLNERATGETRIDMIFRLLAKEYNVNFKLELPENQPLFPFLVFSTILDKKTKDVEEIWRDTEVKFEKMKSWYEDYNQYHLIGYLLSQGRTVSKIQEIISGKGKRQALIALRDEMQKDYPQKFAESDNHGDNDEVQSDADKLAYGSDNSKIKRLLLMFNIAVLLCESDKQTRFPFDIYKKGKWDLEHIHATADNSAEPDDSLGNLTLLNSCINQSYKDKPFYEKRQIIIECEKKGDFIPLCTKNVFLKYYTPDTWNGTDGNTHS